MRPSRWDDWRSPDYRPSADAVGDRDDERLNYRDLMEAEDDSVIPALDAMIAAERGMPILIPLFPVAGFFRPDCPCPHFGPIPAGSTLCCMVCHQSGMDGHSKLRETAAGTLRLKSWEPEGGKDQWGRTVEATAYEGQPGAKGGKPTRKQKRAESRASKAT